MKKRILTTILSLALTLPLVAQAKGIEPDEVNDFKKMHTTAYCQGTTTALGHKVRKGICAVDKGHLGENWVAVVYSADGTEFYGYYECLDTGFGGDADGDGVGSIEEGKCIDIYFPTYEECKEWMKKTKGKCLVKYIWAEG